MGTRQWSYILVYEYESIGGCDWIDLTVGVTLEKKSCDDVSPLVAGLSDLFIYFQKSLKNYPDLCWN